MFEHAVEVAPDLAITHTCLAKLYRKLGRYEDAGREYERAIEVQPEDADAKRKLSEWRAFVTTAPGGSAAE